MEMVNLFTTCQEYSLLLRVRDYECDVQGAVSDAMYLNYLEHARQEYLNQIGLNSKILLERGIYLLAYRIEMDLLRILRWGDLFKVSTYLRKISDEKYLFEQNIYRLKELIVEANIFTLSIDQEGKPARLSPEGLRTPRLIDA